MGWVGFDPTNNILAGERHIRAALGRDYADVPPTRGTLKGDAETELAVAVAVEPTSAPVRHEEFLESGAAHVGATHPFDAGAAVSSAATTAAIALVFCVECVARAMLPALRESA